MNILRRIQNKKLQRLALVTAAVVVCGWGWQRRENRHNQEIAQLKSDFQKERLIYSEKINHLELRLNPFRFYDYDADGIKKSDIDSIKNIKMPSNPGDEFNKFRLPELKKEEVLALAQKWRHEHRKISRDERDDLDKRIDSLVLELSDSLGVFGDENYLRTVGRYRKCVLERSAMYALKEGADKTEALWDRPDAELKEEAYRGDLRFAYYAKIFPKSRVQFTREIAENRQKKHIATVRELIRYNNEMVEDVKVSYRSLFESQKEAQIMRFRKKNPAPENWVDKIIIRDPLRIRKMSYGR